MLLLNLDVLAAAPGGVARLRELILTLAVQGKLVPQNPADEPASVLLEKIRAEKERLMAEGKIKRGKPLAAISEEEKPFEVPVGWEWARCADYFLELCTGPFGSVIHQEDYVRNGVPLINPSHMINGNIVHDPRVTLKQEDAERLSAYALSAGDLVLARRGEVGRYALVTAHEHGWLCGTGSFFVRLHTSCNRSYLGLLFTDSRFRQHLQGESVGTTMTNLNQRILLDSLIAVPPLAEQSRIVTRVEELMQLCDALEAKGRLEAAQHARLVSTLLATLTDSPSPEALAQNWQRVSTHFDLLLDRPEDVDALEQTLLQLAVRGLLVPQDPQDEPASALLERIRTEKDRLIAEGKIKRDKPLAAIAEEEKPFALSSGWEWVPIETLAHVGTGSTPARDNPAYFDGGKIPWATSGETGKFFIHKTAQHVTEIALSQTSLTVYPVGTLIVAMYGQGKTRGQVSELMIEATTNQACAAIVLVEPSAEHRQYVKLVFEKSYEEMRELSAGGAQPNLNVGKIKLTLIPLPPIAEQSRIVARVASLRRLCFELRQRLATSQSTQVQLGEALVASVVG